MFMNVCRRNGTCTQFESDAMIMVVGHQSVHTPDTYLCTLFTLHATSHDQLVDIQLSDIPTFNFQHSKYQAFTNSTFRHSPLNQFLGTAEYYLCTLITQSFMLRVRKGTQDPIPPTRLCLKPHHMV